MRNFIDNNIGQLMDHLHGGDIIRIVQAYSWGVIKNKSLLSTPANGEVFDLAKLSKILQNNR